MRVPLNWLADYVDLPAETDPHALAAEFAAVGLEEEDFFGPEVTGPLVVGRVLDLVKEEHSNGKTVNWCRVDVGPEHNEDLDDPKDPQPGPEVPSRGIICGAHNFVPGDLIVACLPGAVLPGDFAIAARKTYGHKSDGMICSAKELGLGEDHSGIIVLSDLGLTGDEAVGVRAVARAVVEPLRWISENAGLEGYVVVEKVKEAQVGTGLNAATGEYIDLVSAGIIDPVKVTRSALRNAASIAGMVLTTETLVIEKQDDEE